MIPSPWTTYLFDQTYVSSVPLYEHVGCQSASTYCGVSLYLAIFYTSYQISPCGEIQWSNLVMSILCPPTSSWFYTGQLFRSHQRLFQSHYFHARVLFSNPDVLVKNTSPIKWHISPSLPVAEFLPITLSDKVVAPWHCWNNLTKATHLHWQAGHTVVHLLYCSNLDTWRWRIRWRRSVHLEFTTTYYFHLLRQSFCHQFDLLHLLFLPYTI